MKSRQRVTIYRMILWAVLLVLFIVSAYLYMKHDYFRANVALVCGGSILLPGFLYSQISWLRRRYNRHMMHTVEVVVVLSIVLNAIGAMGLYYVGLEYDAVIHFFITAVMAFVAMCFIGVVLYRKNDPYFIGKSLFWGSLVIFLVNAVGWETFEFYGDKFWGTALATDPAQPTVDTWVDIIWDINGIAVAALFGYYNLRHFIQKFRAHEDAVQ